MNRAELMRKFEMSSTTFYRLKAEGLPAEDKKYQIFDPRKVEEWLNARSKTAIKSLVIGGEYTNDEIASAFKCSNQGGMRRSHTANALVLFTDHTGASAYQDSWIDNTLHYTGMGKKGNQTIEKTQNKTLASSNSNGIRIYLFETFTGTQHTYAGQVKLIAEPYTVTELDELGNSRIVYKFPLQIMNSEYLPSENVLENTLKRETRAAKASTFEALKAKAEVASKKNEAAGRNPGGDTQHPESFRLAKKKEFLRDAYIREYVKKAANGICMLCEQKGPFIGKDGQPFLHVHHIEYLSRGGLDIISNCAAVCPNCHARIHELEDRDDSIRLLAKVADRDTATSTS